MAITTVNGLVAAIAAATKLDMYLPSATTVSGGWININKAVSLPWGTLATPPAYGSGGTIHTAGESGFPNLPDVTDPIKRYLITLEMTAATSGTLFLYDRVWSCSGFSGTVTTAQTVVGMPTLTRPDSNGIGLEIWIECYTATGSTASNLTVSYTNQDGTAGRTTASIAHTTSMPANRMYRCTLQAGDTGVRSIQSVTLSASTGTVGNFGVTLMKRIAVIAAPATNLNYSKDYAELGMPIIQNGTCANLVHQGTTTSSGIIFGSATLVSG